MASILDVLNAEQRKAVEQIDGPVMVFAGAGTGKTKTLTARIAYMVAEKDIKIDTNSFAEYEFKD